jgi:hypothetical protein
MVFTKRLREGVRAGRITVSVRIWQSPRVKVGHRYKMEDGEIEIDSLEPMGSPDITPELARASGFLGVIDLLKVAKHGPGEKVYLVRFHYIPPNKVHGKSRFPAGMTERKAKAKAGSSPSRRSGPEMAKFGG